MTWLEEKIYYKKENYFFDLLISISNAKKYIDLETYIFEYDEIGKKILDALNMASTKGVSVRLVVDGFGSFFWISKIKDHLNLGQVCLKIYHPFSLRLLLKLNKRLHRKTCIIDQQIAYLGSFNVTDSHNRDTGVLIRGPEVELAVEAFDKIWFHQWKFWKKWRPLSLLRFNDSIRARHFYNQDLAWRLKKAKRRIWITNAYFVPPLFVLTAIYSSARRKIDVRLLTPGRSDHPFVQWMTETFYKGLLISGVRLFEYHHEKLFLHAKTLIIDDWVMIGSSNIDHRSLFHNLELDVVLGQNSSLLSLEEQFLNDLSHSKEIFLKDLNSNFLLNWALRFLRSWM